MYDSRCERAKLQQKEWTSHKVKKEPGVCSEKVSVLRETARKPQGTKKGSCRRTEEHPGGGKKRAVDVL